MNTFINTVPVTYTTTYSNNLAKFIGLFGSGVLFYLFGQGVSNLNAKSTEESELEETLSLHLDEIYERCAIEFLQNPQVNFTFKLKI